METQLYFNKQTVLSSNLQLHLLGFCLVLISACSIFKEKSFYQADSLSKTNAASKVEKGSVSYSKAMRFFTQSDSADKQYSAEIFPVGLFSYSPEKGFKGKAERVLLNERFKERKQIIASDQLSEATLSTTKATKIKRELTKSGNKEKLIKPNIPMLILALCLILVIVIIYVCREYLILYLSRFFKTI